MVPRWRIFGDFLHPVFSASHTQHVLDLYSKFALRPHHVWKYMVDIQSATTDIRWGKKRNKPNNWEIRLTWISLRKSIVETNWLFMKPPDDRQLSMNCEGLGLDRGLAPTKPQYVATSDCGIWDAASHLPLDITSTYTGWPKNTAHYSMHNINGTTNRKTKLL